MGRDRSRRNPPAVEIEKNDAWGRVVDIHALRTTFCTHLAVAGVHPHVAQQAMRHSRKELTNQYYTDPILLDVAGAVNSLPDFSGSKDSAKSRLVATSRV
jgi:integrase